MPSRTPYTDLLHSQGALITRHPLPEGDEHPFGLDDDELDNIENSREVLMPVEEIDQVLYLDHDDIADSDESQEWQVAQVERGVNAG